MTLDRLVLATITRFLSNYNQFIPRLCSNHATTNYRKCLKIWSKLCSNCFNRALILDVCLFNVQKVFSAIFLESEWNKYSCIKSLIWRGKNANTICQNLWFNLRNKFDVNKIKSLNHSISVKANMLVKLNSLLTQKSNNYNLSQNLGENLFLALILSLPNKPSNVIALLEWLNDLWITDKSELGIA